MKRTWWLFQIMAAGLHMREQWQFESALAELLGIPE